MAGIAGVFATEPQDAVVRRMLDALCHRGPDTMCLFESARRAGGVCAAELSSARGAGFAQREGVTVLFDGDIYNERAEGQSDADVVLGLYRNYGQAFPAYLEGVFACAVYDGPDLLLARDAVGVRPVYCGTLKKGGKCFASEMKALVGVADDIWELPPSTVYSASSSVSRYRPRLPDVLVPTDFDEAKRLVRRLLTDAVERRIEDGAVGACLLSGGLDSSIITCVAHEFNPDLPAVTVGVEGAPDLENARLVAESLGIEHRVHLYTEDEAEALVPKAVVALESFDEDCVSGAIANMMASGVASQFTNCILSGEGGDELFGGYHLLKDLDSGLERLEMMENLIDVAYNTAVQRLDRAMLANQIHYRTPFIDAQVMALALQLPVRWKIHEVEGEPVEKYILREAFRDLLPEQIYKRRKLRFSAGTGTDGFMDRVAEGQDQAADYSEATQHTPEGYTLNSPKELWYYRLFKEHFPEPAFERLVGRWDPDK
ncbi:MAG: asparagine synthase-related protein [Phycisphaerae bacterium]